MLQHAAQAQTTPQKESSEPLTIPEEGVYSARADGAEVHSDAILASFPLRGASCGRLPLLDLSKLAGSKGELPVGSAKAEEMQLLPGSPPSSISSTISQESTLDTNSSQTLSASEVSLPAASLTAFAADSLSLNPAGD